MPTGCFYHACPRALSWVAGAGTTFSPSRKAHPAWALPGRVEHGEVKQPNVTANDDDAGLKISLINSFGEDLFYNFSHVARSGCLHEPPLQACNDAIHIRAEVLIVELFTTVPFLPRTARATFCKVCAYFKTPCSQVLKATAARNSLLRSTT